LFISGLASSSLSLNGDTFRRRLANATCLPIQCARLPRKYCTIRREIGFQPIKAGRMNECILTPVLFSVARTCGGWMEIELDR
jgi:hypothetical protein